MIGAELTDLVERAEATAGREMAEEDAEFEEDLEDYLRRIDDAGWDLATSRTLDPDGRNSIRQAAWWLAGRGVDTCTLGATSIGSVLDAIDDRTEVRISVDADERPLDGEIDIVGYHARDRTLYFVQVTTEKFDGPDDVPDGSLRQLDRVARRLSSTNLDIVPSVCRPESAFGIVERRTANETGENAGTYGLRRTSPPGESGPEVADLTFTDPKPEVLRTVPPCDGAIAGVVAMELLIDRTESAGSRPTTEEALRSRVEAELSAGPLRGRLTQVTRQSQLFSRVKAGGSTYLYPNPGGVVTAAALLRRLGASVSVPESMEAMRDSRKNFGRTISQLNMQIERGKHQSPDRPYGVLPDVFDGNYEG